MRNHYTQLTRIAKKILPSTGKDVEQLVLSYTDGGNVK